MAETPALHEPDDSLPGRWPADDPHTYRYKKTLAEHWNSMMRKLRYVYDRHSKHPWVLHFAVQFAQLDLDRLRPGDWMNLRDDLEQFIYGSHEQRTQALEELAEVVKRSLHDRDLIHREMLRRIRECYHLEPPTPREYPEDAFRALQEDVHSLLRGLVGSREKRGAAITPISVAVHLTIFVVPRMEGTPERRMFVPIGPTRDVFLWILSHLLKQEPTDAIRQCPECETIFYRVSKQQYCSRRCVMRASMRKWRQTETGKQYERVRSQARYEARTKRRTSPNVKVGRKTPSREHKRGG
jgi:hypothetical protein